MGQIIKEQVMSSHLYFSSQQYDYSFSMYMSQTFEALVKRPAKAQPGSAILCCLYSSLVFVFQFTNYSKPPSGGGGVLPYIGYISMCGPKGYGFSAVLVINRVSIEADFGHFGHK